MDSDDNIDRFLEGRPHAVVGASRDRSKYGNKVLRAYLQRNRPVFAVNPHADEVEGLRAFATLSSAPQPIHGVSIVTPPAISEQVTADAIALGIGHLWFQPGAESKAAVSAAQAAGLNVIFGGPCALVVLGFREITP
jgi:predicted CoA-binding protein